MRHLKKRKTMGTMLWDCEGLLLCEFLPLETAVSSGKYSRTLEKVLKAIKRRDQDDYLLE
jgi:hypothetical protein